MNKLLLIIDPQYDFINGSLAVEGAEGKMNALAAYVDSLVDGEYKNVIMTADFHPYNHCSFQQWPVHCVQHTHGAAIYSPLMDSVLGKYPDTTVLTKGEQTDREEYSILKNQIHGQALLNYLSDNSIAEIHICGLCGDFCVGNTIRDLVNEGYGEKIVVLKPYIGNIDDGSVLNSIISDNGLRHKD